MIKFIHINEAYKVLEIKVNESAKRFPTNETYASHNSIRYTIGMDIIGVELFLYTHNEKGNLISRRRSFEQKVRKVCNESTEYSSMVELIND